MSALAPTHRANANPLDADACYQAFVHKDAAWDGRFVMGVTSTHIYCRPVCRVRLPQRANCRFFLHPAQAEAAGFRPCLRCRPELAPAVRWWSLTDAASILATEASQRLMQALSEQRPVPNMQTLARELGVSDRHLRRVFLRHWGVSPLQYLQTQRLLKAKAQLQDSQRPVSEIALACGFGSDRGLRSALARHYHLSPSDLRKGS
jgi:AraC family transcriptional regulator, regulatory protein of adaptative response / DNA-3-methyladenine glycosylase II